jgi:glucose/arabinose dehydrogenase
MVLFCFSDFRHFSVYFMFLALFSVTGAVSAQPDSLPPCAERPTFLNNPWVDGSRWCLEMVIEDESAGRLGFSALATAPDGTLYATRPLTGELYALTDTDGDGIPETPEQVAAGLDRPNGLAYHADALYISGGAHIYRLRDDELEILVDDVPAGAGFWTGGIAIGADERIYVATGGTCPTCDPDDPDDLRGAILSYALDGTDRQISATGLQHSADLAFMGETLWFVDTSVRGAAPDELNVIEPGRDSLDFNVEVPALTFPAGSQPVGLAAYDGVAFPFMDKTLLVTLWGSLNQPRPEGYALVAVRLNDAGEPEDYELLIPASGDAQFSLPEMNYRYSGFWPRRPLDVTVNADGWIYVSAGDGRILVLRPH